jgi:hypothetical protein
VVFEKVETPFLNSRSLPAFSPKVEATGQYLREVFV